MISARLLSQHGGCKQSSAEASLTPDELQAVSGDPFNPYGVKDTPLLPTSSALLSHYL